MKETTQHSQDEIKIEVPAQHQKKQALIHRMRPHANQKLFEYNTENNELKLAEFEEPKTVMYTGNSAGAKKFVPLSRKVIVKPNHLYVTAINFKNAVKQLGKVYQGIKPIILK